MIKKTKLLLLANCLTLEGDIIVEPVIITGFIGEIDGTLWDLDTDIGEDGEDIIEDTDIFWLTTTGDPGGGIVGALFVLFMFWVFGVFGVTFIKLKLFSSDFCFFDIINVLGPPFATFLIF